MKLHSPLALEDFLKRSQDRVNASLSLLLITPSIDSQIPSEKLRSAMEYACLGGGKRIRPILVYASALAAADKFYGDDPGFTQLSATDSATDKAACAVELIHSYSLVHDDLPAMDDDDLRRGNPTVHRAFDEATAILAGDSLHSLAFQLLSGRQQDIPAETQLKMVNVLSEAAGAAGMSGGQSLDFEAVGRDLSLSELETMHTLKTGALIRASVVLGGMSHPTITQQQLESLTTYATNIGLAFQVQDDILDVASDTETLGKPQGSDQLQNKPTYVSLLGIEAARSKAAELVSRGIDALHGFSACADPLRQLASYIVEREH